MSLETSRSYRTGQEYTLQISFMDWLALIASKIKGIQYIFQVRPYEPLPPGPQMLFEQQKIDKRGVSDELVKISKLRGATLPKIEYFLILKQYQTFIQSIFNRKLRGATTFPPNLPTPSLLALNEFILHYKERK